MTREEAEPIADELMALAAAKGEELRQARIDRGEPMPTWKFPDITGLLREDLIETLMKHELAT